MWKKWVLIYLYVSKSSPKFTWIDSFRLSSVHLWVRVASDWFSLCVHWVSLSSISQWVDGLFLLQVPLPRMPPLSSLQLNSNSWWDYRQRQSTIPMPPLNCKRWEVSVPSSSLASACYSVVGRAVGCQSASRWFDPRKWRSTPWARCLWESLTSKKFRSILLFFCRFLLNSKIVLF